MPNVKKSEISQTKREENRKEKENKKQITGKKIHYLLLSRALCAPIFVVHGKLKEKNENDIEKLRKHQHSADKFSLENIIS